jgi:hypothetical protein
MVEAAGERHGPFEAVVNALWEGRPQIDHSVGHQPDAAEHHRYRVSLFVRTGEALRTPSAVVAAGPFGDVKNYDGRSFYLSWYEAGLVAQGDDVSPPPVPELDDDARGRIAAATFAGLGGVLRFAGEIERAASEVRVAGGWVYSQGRGSLADPAAAVHRRSRHGISRVGTYFSVDTGKYSVAPSRARELASLVLAG